MQGIPFTAGATATLSATSTSASVSVSTESGRVEVQNGGASVVFIRIGTGTQTAVTTDYPVLPGHSKVISKPYGADTLAGICLSGQSSTLYVTSGAGV